MTTYTNKLEKIIAQISSGLYEKENSIRLVLLSFLAGESTFMLGEPGTAKSLIARRVSDAFAEPSEEEKEHGVIKFFDYLMSRFSQPDELFGPVSIRQLKDDNYERKTEYYLPKAQFAFLDEIWKANPAIQNALLTILNEHLFRNGKNLLRVPLLGFVSASNELPAQGQGLEAIFDRFLIRVLERPVQDEDSFFNMVSGKADMTVSVDDRLSAEDMDIIRKQSESIRLSDESKCVISNIRKLLTLRNEEPNREDKEKYVISDRRWKKIAGLMRVSAYCNGRDETDLLDAMLIANCIWSTETQENEVRDILTKAIVREDVITSIEKKVQLFEDSINKLFYKEIPIEENGNYKCENRNNGEIVWISKEKQYLINNHRYNNRSNLSFDEESYIYSDGNDSFKVLFETKEIDDVEKLRAFTKEQDKQYEDLVEVFNGGKKGIAEQLNYWRETNNIFIGRDARQRVINALCHHSDVLASLLIKVNGLVGRYHLMLRKSEIPFTLDLVKQTEKTIKEIEKEAINNILCLFKPIIQKKGSKDYIVFNDEKGSELLIPVEEINNIHKSCGFYRYKNGERYDYRYSADLMAVVEERYYWDGRQHSYNMCVRINRAGIKRIIKEANTEYDNLQSKIDELLKDERNAINSDFHLDDERKELVNKLSYESFLPEAKNHLKDIMKILTLRKNYERKLLTLLHSIPSDE